MDQPHQFSDLFDGKQGIWRVYLSARARKDLNESNHEGNIKHIQEKLIQLASGDWIRRSLVAKAGDGIQRQKAQGTLREAVYGSNGRILWQVDVDLDPETNVATQVIIVWKIGDHKEMGKAINSVLYIQKSYSVERMEACKKRNFEKSTGRNLPVEFDDHSVLELKHNTSVESVDSEDEIAPENIYLSNKFYAFTETTSENLSSGNVNIEIPLKPSKEELDVINDFETSTLILGRSGTGKTTCLIYKLVYRYLGKRKVQRETPLRQILLTRSPVLAAELGRQAKCLIDFQKKKKITDTEKKRIKDDSRAGIDVYEKAVTDTITSLKDEDFPVVCTFDHFLKLLENTIRHADQDPSGKNDHQMLDSDAYGGRVRNRSHPQKSQNVDFQVFKNEYWCTFPRHLRGKISEASAFMEIMGIIKGLASAETQFKPLSREEYIAKSFKSAPTFMYTSERNQLYDIYERYERKKREGQARDDIDRVISIFREILANKDLKSMLREALDEIYVDEVQDQRLLEIDLLANIIKDPQGIHFAGDTAQCISRDSTFRFADVKALLFRNFSRLSTIANAPELARPKLIGLYKNFRTHQGILSFASFVMKLLWTEFPAMVDKLPPEIGDYRGPKPTILVNSGPFFKNVSQSTELRREFHPGAEQVIIVRDKDDEEKLSHDIGPDWKILTSTILDSKGMEFDDVFLVDFFTTSECHSQFRSLASSGNTDGVKHMALCTELKQLYVAVTRTRSRLWILESDPSSITSFVELLKREPGQPLVDIIYMNDTQKDESIKSIVQRMCRDKTSNPAEWSTRGREYLHRQNYNKSKFCFENAEDEAGINMAQAFIKEQKGRSYRALGKKRIEYERCFREAAKLFHESNLPFKEATCLEELGEFKKAAVIFSNHGEYEKAASLFELAKCYEEASNNYISAGNYEEGARVLRRGSLFDKLVYYLNEHRDRIDSNTQSHYSRLCNLLLKKGKISSGLETMTVESLGSDSQKESFYSDFELTDELQDFYMAKEKYSEMFDFAVKNGDIGKAWTLVEDHDLHQEIPQTELADVFNYDQARRLVTWISSEPKGTSTRNEKWHPRNSSIPEILAMKRSWQQLACVLNDCQDGTVDHANIYFEKSWMKGFFSVIITTKAQCYIDAANKMSELPIEFVNEVTNMVKSLVTEGEISPSLLLFLGIFPVPKEAGTYRLLDWSPLNPSPDLSAKILDIPAIADKARNWALDRLHPAITQIHGKAWELYKKQYPRRCYFYLTTSNCRKLHGGVCEYCHRLIAQEDFANSIRDLLRATSVYNTFMLLYYRYGWQPDILDQDFAKSFMGHRRVWIERLIAQITFFSSFEHDAGILTKTHHDISCESSEFFGVLGELENLLFYRIGREIKQRHNFSYLLEQLQLAETLGVADRFMKYLTRAFWDLPWYPTKIHARRTLKDILNLRYEKVPGSSETHEHYKTVLWTLEQFPIEDFPSFYAVIAFYEKLATFLIYMSRPTDFLIPNSWVQMYLLRMPGLFTKESQVEQSGTSLTGIQEVESQENSILDSRRWYQQSLLSAVESFCILLHKILGNGKAVITVSAGDRYPKPWQYLARRQIDFLAVIMANLWSISQLPKDITRVWKTVQTIVTDLQVNGDWKRSAPQMLTTKLLEMFKQYNNKDFLLVVTQGGKTSRAFSGLDVRGVSTVSMDSIWSSRVQRATASIPTSNADSQLSSDYSGREEGAAKIIQEFWRTRYPKVRQRRRFFATPIGKAHVFIQTLREKILKKDLRPRERLERIMLLVRDGTELFQRVKVLEYGIGKVQKIAKQQLEGKALTADHLESLQIMWEGLPKMRCIVCEEVTIYTDINEEWLDWPPSKLMEKYDKTKASLDDVEAMLTRSMRSLREFERRANENS